MQQFWIRYYWTRKVWLLTSSVVDIFIPRTCHLFTESQPSADSNADWWIFCVKDPTTHGTWVKGYPCANECPPQEVPHFRFRWILYISAQCLSRNRIVDLVKKNTDVSLDTKLSFCKDACLSMQEVAITNALSYFLIYKLRTLPRGDRYPNRFNSIFEFRQKMIQFNTISQKFN